MPKIGIDATNIALTGKGVSRYQRSLLWGLADSDRSHEYYIFINERNALPRLPEKSNINYVPLSFPAAIYWEQVQMASVIRRFKLDLMHTTTDRLPIIGAGRFVIYLFEIPTYRIEHARRFSPDYGIYQRFSDFYTRFTFSRSLKKASLVATSSANTKRDVETIFGMDGSKVQVIYPAPDEMFKAPANAKVVIETRDRYHAPEGYILHFSSDDPRDNTTTVLKAFALAREALDREVKLVIGGRVDPEHQGFNEIIQRLNLQEAVAFVGYKRGRELVELYQAADLYVDPSLYEGFGFQVAEAMACGVPVASSNVTSLPELVGDAGVLLEPTDVESWAATISKILMEPALRESMRLKQLERAKQFTWKRTIAETLTAYEHVLNGGGPNVD